VDHLERHSAWSRYRISHSEFNHPRPIQSTYYKSGFSRSARIAASYEQRDFPLEEKRGKLRLIAAKDGRDDAVTVHQDVDLFVTIPPWGTGYTSAQTQSPGYRWRGAVMLNGMSLKAGDGAAVSEEEKLEISAKRYQYLWVDITALVALDENFCRCHRSNGHNLVRHHLDTVEPLRA